MIEARFSTRAAFLVLGLGSLLACERAVVLGQERDAPSGAGGAPSGGNSSSAGGEDGAGGLLGQGGTGATSATQDPVCGDGIPEGENEQCDERGGTQTCTVNCMFRNRVTDGLILLYTFQEGEGDQIFDRSGFGAPLNLTIPDLGATSWNETSLDLGKPVLIATDAPPSKVLSAVQATSELTAEAWVVPATLEQGGPARILTISSAEYLRNMTLAQEQDDVIGRIRTTDNGENGLPEFVSPGVLTLELVHLVYVHRSDGEETIYKNGEVVSERNSPGSFSTWDESYRLALGAEFNSALDSRDFLGRMHLIAMYSRALSAEEVVQNFADGP